MKIKVLLVLSLAMLVFLAGCRGSNNANANATNANSNTNVVMGTPTPVQQMASGSDTELRTRIEENLKKRGITGISVEVKDGVATLRGDLQRAKLAEAMQAANEAKPGKVENQLNLK